MRVCVSVCAQTAVYAMKMKKGERNGSAAVVNLAAPSELRYRIGGLGPIGWKHRYALILE